MKNEYDQNTKLHELPEDTAEYSRLFNSENWQSVTVIDSDVQVITHELTDGRDLRKHKDDLRFLTYGPETMIDRKQQKIVDKKMVAR